MKKTVLTFGLISGLIISVLMGGSLLLADKIGSGYQNPFVNMAYTFMEPLPVGLIITLISAAILRRKAPVEPTAAPAVMTT